MKILVTGATGYIGGRLIPKLLEKGYDVRVLVRDPERIKGRRWAGEVEVVKGDLLNPDSLKSVCTGIDTAYYLVHAMYGGKGYEERDRAGAHNFVGAASDVKHVIYLGGLLPESDTVSTHLSSRSEVGTILRKHLPTTEFRAGPIIGSGSASFEMVRYLTDRLPVMVAPKWIHNQVQPISVKDVLNYLISSIGKSPMGAVDIGANVLTFKEMMMQYAGVRGLKRTVLTVPVLAPRLAALWVGLVTPISNSLAVPLVEGVIHPVVGDTRRALELFPDIKPIDYKGSVEKAIEHVLDGEIDTRWSGALGSDDIDYEMTDKEGLFKETRSIYVDAHPDGVFDVFTGLGGDKGWLVWNRAWKLRGLIDRLAGGPGLRRGRRHPQDLLQGEALDFWRVERIDPPSRLRLRAEMKVPGKAWIEWRAEPEGSGTRLVQLALFEPAGILGVLYWRVLYPLHKMIFSDLVRAIMREAEIEKSHLPESVNETKQRA